MSIEPVKRPDYDKKVDKQELWELVKQTTGVTDPKVDPSSKDRLP